MFDQMGMTIRLSEIPECVIYNRLGRKLAKMHPIRRWLSFRKRRELKRRLREAQRAIFIATMEAADNALD